MKTIRDIARKQLAKTGLRVGDAMHYERALDFAESFLAEYLAQKVESIEAREFDGVKWVRLSDAVFLAPPIPAGMVLVSEAELNETSYAKRHRLMAEAKAMLTAVKEK